MVSVNYWVPTTLYIGESQQVSKVKFKLVPECHTHPENQNRSSMLEPLSPLAWHLLFHHTREPA